jgi:hypothetical protein
MAPNVEFISLAFPNPSTELHPISGIPPVDGDFLKRYARTLDEYGFDYTLQPYDSGGADPWTMGATIAAATNKLKVIIALRPNTLYPTVAAKALATLDQLSIISRSCAAHGRARSRSIGRASTTPSRTSAIGSDLSMVQRSRSLSVAARLKPIVSAAA